MIRVGILNVSGYGGIMAAQLVMTHPEMQLVGVTARGGAGSRLASLFPFWTGPDLMMTEALEESCDLVISALPHSSAATALEPFLRSGCRAVDLSADFRLRDLEVYSRWYGAHPCPDLMSGAVYGLPELHATAIAQPTTRVVANPGCYPTAAILALAPALAEGLIEPGVVIDAKSGISGGGRSLTLTNHYSEVNESVAAYALGGHRHLPEIEQELDGLFGSTGRSAEERSLRVTFIPHLVPMTRGLQATCYADLRPGVDMLTVRHAYQRFYATTPYTRVIDSVPQTKWTTGSNMCLVYPAIDERTRRLVAIGCIDNLMKGASSQALQNANLLFGLPETMGLPNQPLYP